MSDKVSTLETLQERYVEQSSIFAKVYKLCRRIAINKRRMFPYISR
jgi:hypothetical protein